MRNRCGGPGDRFLGREVLHGASLEAFLGFFAFFFMAFTFYGVHIERFGLALIYLAWMEWI